MPPKKRVKTSHPVPSTNALSPSAISAPWPALSGMPLDILLTIARVGELTPEDLYYLAQTCRKIRGCLWSRAAECEWRIAIGVATRRGSLPTAQPSCMSIPAFMHLLFSLHCQICGRAMRAFLGICLVRICKRCVPKAFVWYGDAAEQVRSLNGDLTDDILQHKNLSQYFAVLYPSADKDDESRNLILQRDVDRVIKLYTKLTLPVSKDDLLTFTNTLRADCADRRKHSREIQERLEDNRCWDIQEGKRQRFEDILARLRGEGWGKELEYLGPNNVEDISKFPFVRQSAKLTDVGWTKVWQALGPFLSKTREHRLQNEYREAICSRLKILDEAIIVHCVPLPRKPSSIDIRPEPIDLAFAPKCRAILDRPLSDSLTPEHFARVIPGLVRNWNTEIRKQLTGYLRRHIEHIPARVDPLTLAIAVFVCRHCTEDLNRQISAFRYPAILSHVCLRRTKSAIPSATDDLYTRTLMQPITSAETLAHYEEKGYTSTSHVPFHTGCLEDEPAARRAIERMRRIVSALGLDGVRATIEELDTCEGWLRCTRCESDDPEEPVRRVYDWQAAYAHEDQHFGKTDDAAARGLWHRVDQQEVLDTIQTLVASKDGSHKKETRWCCSLCPTFDAYDGWMRKHLATEHGIKDIEQAAADGTVYRHVRMSGYNGHCVKIPLFMRNYGSASDSEAESDTSTESGESSDEDSK